MGRKIGDFVIVDQVKMVIDDCPENQPDNQEDCTLDDCEDTSCVAWRVVDAAKVEARNANPWSMKMDPWAAPRLVCECEMVDP